MNSNIRIRGRSLTPSARPRRDKTISDVETAGQFERLLLLAFELRQPYRDAFLLSDVQGHTLLQTAGILGVSPEIAVARLKQARRKLQRFGLEGWERAK